MDAAEQRREQISVSFVATPLELIGRLLLAALASLPIVSIPWVTAWLNRWYADHIRLSNQTKVSFEGTGGQIWLPMLAILALPFATPLVTRVVHAPLLVFAFSILRFLLTVYLTLLIARWLVASVRLSSGTRLAFAGEFLPLLGWNILLPLSIVTIIGWAWVYVAMINWFCRNIRVGNHLVEFHGNGWNVLWRTMVFALSCMLVIPIPWTYLWLIKWFFSNLSVTKGTAEGVMAADSAAPMPGWQSETVPVVS